MQSPSLFEQLHHHSLAGARGDFARARTRRPALAGYETASAAVSALRQRAPPGHVSKNALTAALVAEANAGA